MELERGWPKIWEDVEKAGVLPGVDQEVYRQRYVENTLTEVRPFLLTLPAVLSPGVTAEIHRRQFAGLTPWAGNWAKQAIIGEFRGSPEYRTALELRLLEDQTRRLLKVIDRTDLNQIARVAAFMHARFEAIHPFPDGNGRVGRIALSHFIEHVTAKANLAGPRRGLRKGNHPDKLAYVQALIEARKTHNLAPLARHFQFELTGKAEDLSFLPSPFQIGPRSLPEETYAREFRESVRDPVEAIAAPGLPLRRPWLLDATIEPLRRLVPPDAKAGNGFQAARKLLTVNRGKALSLGEAVAVLKEVRELKPYSMGLLGRDMGAEPFQRWAQEIFSPLLRSLDEPSNVRLRVAINSQMESGGEPSATDAALSTAKGARFAPPAPDYIQVARATMYASLKAPPARSRRPAPGKGQSLAPEL
jgi:fido (protein-threonine AMPylation protein)